MFFRQSRVLSLLTLLIFLSNNFLYASVRIPQQLEIPRLNLPAELGIIRENFQGAPKSPLVIYIQENHADPAAQKKIAEIIQFVQKQNGTSILAVEGASGEIPVHSLRKNSSNVKHKESAEQLLKELILDGASYAAIFSKKPFLFFGVETPELYKENLKYFRKVKQNSLEIQNYLTRTQNEMELKIKKTCSIRLRQLYEHEEKFEEEQNGLDAWSRYLIEAAELSGQSFSGLSQIMILNRLFKNETLLGDKTFTDSGSFSIDYLLNHPRIRAHMEQKFLKEKINAVQLMSELTILKNRIKEELFRNESEKRLDRNREQFKRTQRLLRLKALREDILSGALNDAPGIQDVFRFYRTAENRDQEMARNFSNMLRHQHESSAFLVTGGFHTEGITRIFRKNNISYLVISPNVDHPDQKENDYELRLSGNFEFSALAAERFAADPDRRLRLARMWAGLEGQDHLSRRTVREAYQNAAANSLGSDNRNPDTPEKKSILQSLVSVNIYYRYIKPVFGLIRIFFRRLIETLKVSLLGEPGGWREEEVRFHRLKQHLLLDFEKRIARPKDEQEKIKLKTIHAIISGIEARPGNSILLKYFQSVLESKEWPPFLDIEELKNLDFIVLDTETTGTSRKDDRILEVTAIRYRGFQEIERFSTLVNPGEDITWSWIIPLINGITRGLLRGRNVQTSKEALTGLNQFLKKHSGAVLVAHNAHFDLLLIKNEMKRHGLDSFYYDIADSLDEAIEAKKGRGKNRIAIDTLKMARELFPKTPSRETWLGRLLQELFPSRPYYTAKHIKNPPDVPNHQLGTMLKYLRVSASFHRTDQDVAADYLLFLVLSSMQIKKRSRVPKNEAEQMAYERNKAREILKRMYPYVAGRFDVSKTRDGYFMETSLEHIEAVMDQLNIGPGMNVVDLGAGDGRISIAAALRGAESVGFESDWKLHKRFETKRRQFIRISEKEGKADAGKMLSVSRKNFFEQDFSDYDIIFYSVGGTPDEERLEEKLIHEMKPGALLVALTHIPVSGNYFQDLELVSRGAGKSMSQRFYQIYQNPVAVVSNEGRPVRFSRDKWMEGFNAKIEDNVVVLDRSKKIVSKKKGNFQIRLVPERDMSKRKKIRNFSEVPEQYLFNLALYGRKYIFAVNRYPGVEGQSLIHEHVKPGVEASPQTIQGDKLRDLVVFQMRYPFMKLGYNGGRKAGASVNAFHAQVFPDISLPVESWKRVRVGQKNNVWVERLVGYPATVIRFSRGDSGSRAHLAEEFLKIARENDIPHNLLIGDEGAIYLFLRDPNTERSDLGVLEHSGIFLAQNQAAYKKWDSEEVLRNELESVALKEADFKRLFESLVSSMTSDKGYVSFASASSLGKTIQNLLIVSKDPSSRKQLIEKLKAVGLLLREKREFKIFQAGSQNDALTTIESKRGGPEAIQLVISFLVTGQVRVGIFKKEPTYALQLFNRVQEYKIPFIALQIRDDMRNRERDSEIKSLAELEDNKTPGFLGLFNFDTPNVKGHIETVIERMERQYAEIERKKQEAARKKIEAEEEARRKKERSERLARQAAELERARIEDERKQAEKKKQAEMEARKKAEAERTAREERDRKEKERIEAEQAEKLKKEIRQLEDPVLATDKKAEQAPAESAELPEQTAQTESPKWGDGVTKPEPVKNDDTLPPGYILPEGETKTDDNPATASSLGQYRIRDLVGGKVNEEYLKRIGKIVNSGRDRNKPSVALYVGSGADISTALLTTDADYFIFVDQISFNSKKRFKPSDKQIVLDNYLDYKKAYGYAKGDHLRKASGIRMFLLKELETMRAANIRVSRISSKLNRHQITFNWGGKKRKIIFISRTNGRNIVNFKKELEEIGGVDFFIQKSGEYAASSYERIRLSNGQIHMRHSTSAMHQLTDEVVRDWLRPGGFLILDVAQVQPTGIVRNGLERVDDEQLRTLESQERIRFGYITFNGKDGVYLYQKKEQEPVSAASLGLFQPVELGIQKRSEAWFDRNEKFGDPVVFLLNRNTLDELTEAEKRELNYHLKFKNRKLILVHDSGDKHLNVEGLSGNIQHWWGSPEDYFQVLNRARHPHVVYLSGNSETSRFSNPKLLNVKHALYAPTAAVEYLFQGRIDLYGIWQKDEDRFILSLSDKVEALFGEITARRWIAQAA